MQNRRLKKTVESWSGSGWNLTKDLRFVYDGWQMIAELDHTFATETGLAGSAMNRTFLWGPDLSGTMTGAGGVGGHPYNAVGINLNTAKANPGCKTSDCITLCYAVICNANLATGDTDAAKKVKKAYIGSKGDGVTVAKALVSLGWKPFITTGTSPIIITRTLVEQKGLILTTLSMMLLSSNRLRKTSVRATTMDYPSLAASPTLHLGGHWSVHDSAKVQ